MIGRTVRVGLRLRQIGLVQPRRKGLAEFVGSVCSVRSVQFGPSGQPCLSAEVCQVARVLLVRLGRSSRGDLAWSVGPVGSVLNDPVEWVRFA